MKLLIVTQVIDTEHPVLGFFHRWVVAFAAQCTEVHVIALQVGTHALPANVKVYSLGKENGTSRTERIIRLCSLVWSLRHSYDSVFVHMNQEYLLLVGWLWKLLGKRVTFWRNHYAGNWLTDVAAWWSDAVFYTSSSSYTKKFAHAHAMPIGIEESLFQPQPVERQHGSLLYVGRLSRSKRIDVILESLRQARKINDTLTLTIVGGPTSPDDEHYRAELEAFIAEHALPVTFAGPVAWDTLPTIYSAHELCINLSPPGMFDKVIGEALLCGCDVVTTNKDLTYLLGKRVIDAAEPLAPLTQCLSQTRYDYAHVKEVSRVIASHHSLSALVKGVIAYC